MTASDATLESTNVERTDLDALQHRIRKNVVGAVAGRLLGILSTLFATAVMGRLMANDFGIFQTLLTVVLPLSWLFSAGMSSVAVRVLGEEFAAGRAPLFVVRRIIAVAFAAATLGACLTAIVFAFWGRTLCARWNIPYETTLLTAYTLAICLLAVQQSAAESLAGLHETRLSGFLAGGLMGGPLTTLLFTCLLIGASMGRFDTNPYVLSFGSLGSLSFRHLSVSQAMFFLAISLAVSLPISLGVLFVYARSEKGVSPATFTEMPTGYSLTKVLALSIPLLLIQLATFVTSTADVWIAADVFAHDRHDLNCYVAARRLTMVAAMPLYLAAALVSPMITASFCAGDRDRLQRVVRLGAIAGAIPAFALSLACLVAPRAIVTWYLGPAYGDAAGPIVILAVAQLIVAWSGTGGTALTLCGCQRSVLFVSVAAGIFMIAVCPWAARTYGPNGAAYVSGAAWLLKYLTELMLARRFLALRAETRLGDVTLLRNELSPKSA